MREADEREGDVHLAQSAETCAATRDALTRRLQPRVHRLVASFLRNHADAEDATQVALLEILRAMPSFRGESKLETWADRIAVRAAIRIARTRRLAAVRTHDALDPDELPHPSAESVTSEELPRALLVYLSALPETRRTVLVLRHSLGYSIREIAELTGASENTVK
ncbi:MAG TPA: sigma-70 family RNA polymerase sigma factor, partial [Polyangiales bacterium]|nr:sigma-70 family RNA polymerase sigma factor [Polyangiales bacterium]